jgi:hypothetical protein
MILTSCVCATRLLRISAANVGPIRIPAELDNLTGGGFLVAPALPVSVPTSRVEVRGTSPLASTGILTVECASWPACSQRIPPAVVCGTRPGQLVVLFWREAEDLAGASRGTAPSRCGTNRKIVPAAVVFSLKAERKEISGLLPQSWRSDHQR